MPDIFKEILYILAGIAIVLLIMCFIGWIVSTPIGVGVFIFICLIVVGGFLGMLLYDIFEV